MADVKFNRGMKELLDGTIDWLNDTIKIMLVDNTYSPNPDDDFLSSAASAELSGTGYEAGFAGTGRQTLGTKTIVEDDGNNCANAGAADVAWAAINAGTIAGAIVYKHLTDDAHSVMIGYFDVPNTITNGGPININWTGGQVMRLS
jgi:hypothetical protein